MARVYISDESKKQGYLTRQREYMEYLKSPAWKQKRAEVMAVYENKCMNCGCSSEPLDVHHIRYAEVLGNETIKDFRVLCRTCHDAEHSASKKKKKSRKKNMHVRAAWSHLTTIQKSKIMLKHSISSEAELYCMVMRADKGVTRDVCNALGVDWLVRSQKRVTIM